MEEGSSYTDESMLTGEVAPVPKRPGDPVIGGTVNLQSMLQVVLFFPIPLLPSANLPPLHAHGQKSVWGVGELAPLLICLASVLHALGSSSYRAWAVF